MVGFLKFLKRKRAGGRLSSPADYPFKNRSDSASTSLDDSTEHEEAPWRATAVLDHTPIQEKDWWTTRPTIVDENDDEQSHEMTREDGGTDLDSPSAQQKQNVVGHDESVEMHFHNRGLEIWQHCREAWRQDSAVVVVTDDATKTSSRKKPAKPLGGMQRRSVVAGLSRHREYKLPRRIRLEELVGVHQDIWHQDSSD